jgi:hypothetical protein
MAQDLHADRAAGITLGHVLDVLSEAVVDLVVAPAGLEVLIGTAVIHDGTPGSPVGRGDVVLGVGIDPRAPTIGALVDDLGRQGATALVLKFDDALPQAIERRAADAGIALLRASRIDWGQLYTLVRTATVASSAPSAPGVRAAPLGDLFSLANAIAATVGGATTIEDRQLQVLAHSNLAGQPVDRIRLDSIVGRKVPVDIRRETAELYRMVWRSEGAVRMPAHEPTESRARLAIAVKAGTEVLGTIWVLEGTAPFSPADELALGEAARLAALHLMRHAASSDVERQRRGELARSVLEGRVPFATIVRELTNDEAVECTVVGFEMPDLDDDEAEAQRTVDRLVDMVALHAESHRRSSAAVALGSRAYLILVEPAGTGAARRREVVEEIVRRARHAVSPTTIAALGSTTCDPSALHTSRSDADVALRVVRRDGFGPVVHVDDVRRQVAILRLCDVIAADAELRTDLLDRLRRHDAEHDTEYVRTASAYITATGIVADAARRLFVHPNTLRYRLRRMKEATGVDLDDPDTRLLLDLELRAQGGGRS